MRSVAAWLAVSVIAGCARAPAPEELYGSYVGEYPYAREELELLRGGRYIQRLDVRGMGVATNQGEWGVVLGAVVLERSLVVADHVGQLNPQFRAPVDGARVLDTQRSCVLFGRPMLIANPDQDFVLRRVE